MSDPTSSDSAHIELQRARIASAQRFELVGQLAGPLTHEINNALGVVIMYTDMLRSTLDPDSEARADLDEILAAAQRAAEFSKWLNAWSGSSATQAATPVSFTSILDHLGKVLTKYLSAGGIELRIEEGDAPPVAAPPEEVRDLVLALIADLRWSLESGTIEVAITATPDAARLTLTGRGALTGIGELDDFSFLAPGPSDAGTARATSTLRDRVERLGGRLRREGSEGLLRYRLELPTSAPE
ncbi:MAG: hypothetical protein RQ745_07365 [Longimicrobiales bacterium]|nr:hypothetical protein [Longimicrobiales bacterium]